MDPLIEGYRKFRAETWPAERARYEALAHWGQSPDTMIIACSDSRVDPQTIFGAVPGEMFVLRNVAALVPPYQPEVGRLSRHQRGDRIRRAGAEGRRGSWCSATPNAAASRRWPSARRRRRAISSPPGSTSASRRSPSAARPTPVRRLAEIEAGVVRLSLANLMTFPWVAEAVDAGRLALQGYIFDIHTGVLSRVLPDGVEAGRLKSAALRCPTVSRR